MFVMPKDFLGLDRAWTHGEANLEDELFAFDFFRDEPKYNPEAPLVLSKAGGLIAFLSMDGVDPEPIDQEEFNRASQAVRRAMDNFNQDYLDPDWKGGRWEVMNTLERTKGQAAKLAGVQKPSQALEFLVESTNRHWAKKLLFQDRLTWAVHFLPKTSGETKLWSLRRPEIIVELQMTLMAAMARMVRRKVKSFEEDLIAFTTERPRMGFRPHWMSEKEIYEFLYRQVNRRPTEPAPLDPDLPLVTQIALSSRDNSGKHYRVDKQYAGVLTWKNPPKGSKGNCLRPFQEQCLFPFTLTHIFQSTAGDERMKMLSRNLPIAQVLGERSQASKEWAEEAAEYMDSVTLDAATPFDWKFSATVTGDDLQEYEERISKLSSWIKTVSGAEPMEEGKDTRKLAELASIPGNGFMNRRTSIATSRNAGELAFVYRLAAGDQSPHLLFQDRRGGYCGFNLFSPALPNWNCGVLGGPGSGKSVLMNQMVLGLAGYESQIYVLDLGNSFGPSFEFLAGEKPDQVAVMRLEGGKFQFNPVSLVWAIQEKDRQIKEGTYQRPLDDGQVLPCPMASAKNLFEGWLEVLVGDGRMLNPTERNHLQKALKGRDGGGGFFHAYEELCRDYLAQMAADSTLDLKPPSPLSRLLPFLRQEAPEFVDAVEVWTRDEDKEFFDSGLDSLSSAKMVYFELTGLDKRPRLTKPFVAALMTTIWRRITDPRFIHERKIIVIDEAWKFLSEPSFAHIIEEMFRTIRKFNGFVVLSTQTPDDIKKGEAVRLLRTMSHMFLYRGFADEEFFKEHLLMTDHQIELHKSVQSDDKVREVLHWDQNGQVRIWGVDLDPVRYWFSSSNADDKGVRARFSRHYGSKELAAEKLAEACGWKTIISSALRMRAVEDFAKKAEIL